MENKPPDINGQAAVASWDPERRLVSGAFEIRTSATGCLGLVK